MSQEDQGFSIEQHSELGEELREMHSRFIAIGADLREAYSHESDIVIENERVIWALIGLRQKLDLVAINEFGDEGTDKYVRSGRAN